MELHIPSCQPAQSDDQGLVSMHRTFASNQWRISHPATLLSSLFRISVRIFTSFHVIFSPHKQPKHQTVKIGSAMPQADIVTSVVSHEFAIILHYALLVQAIDPIPKTTSPSLRRQPRNKEIAGYPRSDNAQSRLTNPQDSPQRPQRPPQAPASTSRASGRRRRPNQSRPGCCHGRRCRPG